VDRRSVKDAENGGDPFQYSPCQASTATDVASQNWLSPARERSASADRVRRNTKHKGRDNWNRAHKTCSPSPDENILG
jgi:hypothetical protein